MFVTFVYLGGLMLGWLTAVVTPTPYTTGRKECAESEFVKV